jgi:hypothetical protein
MGRQSDVACVHGGVFQPWPKVEERTNAAANSTISSRAVAGIFVPGAAHDTK